MYRIIAHHQQIASMRPFVVSYSETSYSRFTHARFSSHVDPFPMGISPNWCPLVGIFSAWVCSGLKTSGEVVGGTLPEWVPVPTSGPCSKLLVLYSARRSKNNSSS